MPAAYPAAPDRCPDPRRPFVPKSIVIDGSDPIALGRERECDIRLRVEEDDREGLTGVALGERPDPVGLAGTLLIGMLVEVVTLRALYDRDHLDQVLATFGLILFFNELVAVFCRSVRESLDSRTSEIVRSVPSSRLTANQSQPPPPTAMKSPHWWSNQAVPSTSSVRSSTVIVPAADIAVRE